MAEHKAHTYLLCVLALEILRQAIKRDDTLAVPSKVHSVLGLALQAIQSPYEELRLSGYRFASVAVERTSVTVISQDFADISMKVLADYPSSNSPIYREVITFLLNALENVQRFELNRRSLSLLLDRANADLEETDLQDISFKVVHAIWKRSGLPEMHDTIDAAARLLVTSQVDHTRAMARQLLLDYLFSPSGAGRAEHFLIMVARNIEYEHETGRQSVLETLYGFEGLLAASSLQKMLKYDDFGLLAFGPLVLCVANDESELCRIMALNILRRIFSGVSKRTMRDFVRQGKDLLSRLQLLASPRDDSSTDTVIEDTNPQLIALADLFARS